DPAMLLDQPEKNLLFVNAQGHGFGTFRHQMNLLPR
ncbi:MAG: hypothetical protein QOJ87_1917, partial [Verrucomicrobiota bacterium]